MVYSSGLVQGEFTLTTNQHGPCGEVPGHMFVMRGLLGLPDQWGKQSRPARGTRQLAGLQERCVWNWVPEARPKQSEGPSLDHGAREGRRGPCARVRRVPGPSILPAQLGLRDYAPRDTPICVAHWGTASKCQAFMDFRPPATLRAASHASRGVSRMSLCWCWCFCSGRVT